MPPQRKLKRKRSGPYDSRTYKKRKVAAGTVARTRGFNPGLGEMKYDDVLRGFNAIVASTSWTGCMQDPTAGTLFVPAQGAGSDERIGKGCKLFKLKIRGSIRILAQTGQVSPDEATLIRLILVHDMQTNGTQMASTDLMSAGVSTDDAVHAFMKVDGFGRFNILKDKTIRMQNPDATWDGTTTFQSGLIVPFKFNVTFRKPIEVRFKGSTSAVADIVDHSFHVLANCNSTSMQPQITYVARGCFKD